jgi:two-component system, LytTR family, sensor histidine kinase AlgZ
MNPTHPARILLMNMCAAAAVPLLFVFFGAVHDPVQLGGYFVYSFVYANCIGFPAAILLPRIAAAYQHRGRALLPAISLSMALIAIAGCLLAGAITIEIGLVPRDQYWREFSSAARLSTLLALTSGLTIFFYKRLRGQLDAANIKLKEKELDEERARKLAAEARLSSLESRIHPHFLFNTLNSISSLIPVHPDRAEEIVGRLAALLRSSLDTSRESLIPLSQELSIVRDYLEIEKARFGERLEYSIEVPAGFAGVEVPPMSVQSLAENAVKHGIAGRKSGGCIRIAASASGGRLRLEVRDSGPGFELTEMRSGHGLENLIDRIEMLYGPEGRVEVTRQDGECVVAMVVPQPQPA